MEEVLYKEAFDNAKDSMFLLDKYGKIIKVNKESIREYGYTYEEFMSMTIEELTKAEDKSVLNIQFNLAKTRSVTFETNHIRKNGTNVPVEVHFIDADINGSQYVITSVRNIEYRKSLYELIKKLTDEKERNYIMKNQFLASINHELRTPMNGILGFVQLLKLTDLNHEQKDDLDMIEISSKKLLGTIDKILDISQIETGKIKLNYEKFNLQQQIQRIIEELKVIGKSKGLEIMYYIDPSIRDEFLGDEARLGQIIMNLINNAAQFTKRGYIYFKVKKIYADNQETKLQFSIEDTGIGISDSFGNKIFEIFSKEQYSYVKTFDGAGLGLPICKKLVSMMNGNIWYESKLGRGSTFYFTIVLKNVCCKKQFRDVLIIH